MVNWKLAKEDPYYSARELEERARTKRSAEAWEEFADLKAKKGSYTLAVHGYLNSALICEQEKRLETALDLLEKAFQNARRTRSKELTVIVAYRRALLAEQVKQWDRCIAVYEELGAFCEELGSYFLAADAYEHAAEVMVKVGRDTAAYNKPIELWRENARYWRELGQEDDAQWSERHIALYTSLFGVRPA
jgi:tetratricopeptide (TPR) repeat protein